MSDGTFTIPRPEFLRRMMLGQVQLDNEYLPANVGDPDAFRFGWRWSWLRMWWVPFDNMERGG